MKKRELYDLCSQRLAKEFPEAATELHFSSPYELLCAVMLSAQCTDKRVNMVTPALFKAFPTVQDMAAATPEQIFPYVKSVSYPNAKSQHLAQMARMVCEKFGGEIPQDLDSMTQLPGVGRKTANVTGSNPYLRVHQDGAVYANVIWALLDEFLPPGCLNIILQLYAQRTEVPGIRQTTVNIGTRIYETSCLGKGYDFFH